MHHADPRLQRVIELYQGLQPTDLQRLVRCYTDDAYFKDPFHEVHSRADIERIFARMFSTLDEPRFVVPQALAQGDDAFLVWDFHFRFKSRGAPAQCIRGASQLRFAPDGRVALHRDWWDAAEEVYEKLPLVGVLMRWLKRRVQDERRIGQAVRRP